MTSGALFTGKTVEEAIANRKETAALYLEEFPSAARGHPLATVFSAPEPAHAQAAPDTS